MNLRQLYALNSIRWIREHVWAWGALGGVTSLAASILLQRLVEVALDLQLPLPQIWILLWVVLSIAAVLEYLPFGAFPYRIQTNPKKTSFIDLYVLQDLRRYSTWFAIALVVLGGVYLLPEQAALWILVAQLPSQRAFFSVGRWRALAVFFESQSGAMSLLWGFVLSQFLQSLTICLALTLVTGDFGFKLWIAILTASLASASVSLEGDSGRPWLVNFAGLAAGTLAGLLTLAVPWIGLMVLYFAIQMPRIVKNRIHSVENFNEDTLIS